MARRGDDRNSAERDEDRRLAQERFKAKTLAEQAQAKYYDGRGDQGGAVNPEMMKNPYFAKAFAGAQNSIVGGNADTRRYANEYAMAQGLKAMGAQGMERDKALFDERMPENRKFMTEQETSRMNARIPVEIEGLRGQVQRDVTGMQYGPGGFGDRSNRSEEARTRMMTGAQMYGDDKRYEGLKYQTDIGSGDKRYEVDTIHGPEGSSRYNAGLQSMSQIEEARRRAMAQQMESDAKMATELMTNPMNPMTAIQARDTVNTFRGGGMSGGMPQRPERNIYDDDIRPMSQGQRSRQTMEADAAYEKMFGGGQAAQKPMTGLQTMAAPPQLNRMEMAQPIPQKSASQPFAQTIRSQGAQSAFGNAVSTPILPTLWERFKRNRQNRPGENIYKTNAVTGVRN